MLEAWLEGMRQAREEQQQDTATFHDLDTYLEVDAKTARDIEIYESLLTKVQRENTRTPGAAGAIRTLREHVQRHVRRSIKARIRIWKAG